MNINATTLLSLGYLATFIGQIPWTLIFLLTQIFGVRMYTLKTREECVRIQKRIGNNCSNTDGEKGFGYAVGFWYIISITVDKSDHGDHYSVWMIATSATYKMLTEEKHISTVQGPYIGTNGSLQEFYQLSIYERVGTYYNPWLKRRTLPVLSKTPRPEQELVIDTIRQHYAKEKHSVVYLYGPPGSGKSLIAVFLALSYKGSYCNSVKPWQPGDTLALIYSEAEPTEDKPLVLVFDEFDTALVRIHEGIEPHKSQPIQIADKTGWNQMLDEFQLGMYPNMILVLTSNRTPEFIREMDPSYIREGRVDLTFHVVSKTVEIPEKKLN